MIGYFGKIAFWTNIYLYQRIFNRFFLRKFLSSLRKFELRSGDWKNLIARVLSPPWAGVDLILKMTSFEQELQTLLINAFSSSASASALRQLMKLPKIMLSSRHVCNSPQYSSGLRPQKKLEYQKSCKSKRICGQTGTKSTYRTSPIRRWTLVYRRHRYVS